MGRFLLNYRIISTLILSTMRVYGAIFTEQPYQTESNTFGTRSSETQLVRPPPKSTNVRAFFHYNTKHKLSLIKTTPVITQMDQTFPYIQEDYQKIGESLVHSTNYILWPKI